MRTVAILGLAIGLAGAWNGLPAAAADGDAPARYAEQFGKEEAKVVRTAATVDDAEFAAKLMDRAGKLEGDPKGKAFLCDKAYAFGIKSIAGCPTAIDALTALRTCTTGREAELDAKRIEVCEAWLRLERGPQREAVIMRLVRVLVDAAERAAARGEFDRAVGIYERASKVALAAKLPQAKDIASRILFLTDASGVRKDVAGAEKALKAQPDSPSLATRLAMMYLVEMDDPAKAVGLFDKAEPAESVRRYAPAAAKGPEDADEQLARDLGDWYAALADRAEGYARYLMLRRTRAFYQRFLALHENKDDAQVRVALELEKVNKVLAPLQPPNVPIELLDSIDVKRDAIAGEWCRIPEGLLVKGPKYGLLALPGPEGSSYELTVLFTRTGGNNSVYVTFPVGGKQCVLVLCGWDGATSGLCSVGGKDAQENATKVKGKLIVNGKANTLHMIVKTSGNGDASITGELNGKQIVSWQGSQDALSMGLPAGATPKNSALALGITEGLAIFHAARMVLVR